MTNEERLAEIYDIVTRQEARRKSGIYFFICKWLIIASLAYFVFSHPKEVIGKITEIVKPIVMEEVKTMMQDQKTELQESLKNMLPAQ